MSTNSLAVAGVASIVLERREGRVPEGSTRSREIADEVHEETGAA
jgi:hypothetical protein